MSQGNDQNQIPKPPVSPSHWQLAWRQPSPMFGIPAKVILITAILSAFAAFACSMSSLYFMYLNMASDISLILSIPIMGSAGLSAVAFGKAFLNPYMRQATQPPVGRTVFYRTSSFLPVRNRSTTTKRNDRPARIAKARPPGRPRTR